MQEFDDLPEPPQWPKKVIAVFLIILFVGLSSLGGYAGFVYISYLFGTDVIDGTAIKNDVTYSFDSRTWNAIQQIYLQEQRTEFVVCLYGEISDSRYDITTLSLPQTFERGFRHVRYEGCPADSIGTLHSHPYRRCQPSGQDRATLETMQEGAVGFVMCDVNRLGIY